MRRKTADKSNRRIDEELVCVDALKHVLCAVCGCKDVHAHREKQDPPDFTVMVDGEQFPAEVTSIVSRQQYHEQCKEFAEAIRNQADSQRKLHGTYAFIVTHLPVLPRPASKGGRKLLDAAIAYIESTKQAIVSSEFQIATAAEGQISIEKVSASGATVSFCGIPPLMWEGEIQAQLSTLIQEVVDTKHRKLEKAGIGSEKALLLLFDAYGYGEPIDAVAAMQHLNGHDWFHSVFWVASFCDRKNITYPDEPGRGGLFLFSHNPAWIGRGTVRVENGT
jgi:hypothetical protein